MRTTLPDGGSLHPPAADRALALRTPIKAPWMNRCSTRQAPLLHRACLVLGDALKAQGISKSVSETFPAALCLEGRGRSELAVCRGRKEGKNYGLMKRVGEDRFPARHALKVFALPSRHARPDPPFRRGRCAARLRFLRVLAAYPDAYRDTRPASSTGEHWVGLKRALNVQGVQAARSAPDQALCGFSGIGQGPVVEHWK